MYKRRVVWQAHEGNLSGANIAMLEYADALHDEYDFYFIVPARGKLTEHLAKRGFGFSVIPQYGWAVSGKRIATDILRQKLRNVIASVETLRLLRVFKPDMVFTNTQVTYISARAADKLDISHVWWLHEFGEEDFGFRIGFGNRKRAISLMRRSELIVANSKAVKRKFSALLGNVNLRCVYQPVKMECMSSQKLPHNYLMFGQISPTKGQAEVLKALAETRKENLPIGFHLTIAGPCEFSDYLDQLHALISKHCLNEHVTILPKYLDKCVAFTGKSILISASRSEAFGRVLVEAIKNNMHVLVKASGGAPELVNETNGILFQDFAELTQIFEGKRKLPSAEILLNYNEHDELMKLKQELTAIA